MSKSKNFEFHGGAASYLGVGIASFLLTVFTFGIALPWAITMRQRWKTNNMSINGRRIEFTGTGFSLIGNWIKWLFLCFITLGIYSFWVGPKLQAWIVEHTDFVAI